jgi:hypothetical protein
MNSMGEHLFEKRGCKSGFTRWYRGTQDQLLQLFPNIIVVDYDVYYSVEVGLWGEKASDNFWKIRQIGTCPLFDKQSFLCDGYSSGTAYPFCFPDNK